MAEYQEFPRCLYKGADESKIVNTPEEKAAALKEGWSLTVGGGADWYTSSKLRVDPPAPEESPVEDAEIDAEIAAPKKRAYTKRAKA